MSLRFSDKSHIIKHFGSIIISMLAAVALSIYPVYANPLLSLDSSHVIFHAHGPDTMSFLGSLISSLGDINGDGFDDIAVSCSSPTMATYIYYGGNPCNSIEDQVIYGSVDAVGKVDLDGDGINDVVTSRIYGYSTTNRGVVYLYKGFGDSLGSMPYDSMVLAMPNYGFGWIKALDYVDSDSLADMLTFQPFTPGGPTLLYFNGPLDSSSQPQWTFSVSGYSHLFSDYGFIDFNGDGKKDIYLGLTARLDTTNYVYIFYGPNFGTTPDKIIGRPQIPDSTDPESFAEGVFNVGDVDGDSWEELTIDFANIMLLYRTGPYADTLYDYRLDYGFHAVAAAGDINGDGWNDLVAGHYDGFYAGAVMVYLGGPEWDVYFDGYLDEYQFPPSYLDKIGQRVSTASDFNGDGIDDFFFSCQNFASGDPGDVFVVKGGTDIVSEVEEIPIIKLPENIILRQNYPNPFNPNTEISFSLPRAGAVQLDVFNILGQRVISLIDGELPAGHHTVSWDGEDINGNQVASGVYFCRLKTDNFEQTRKMQLLK
jgi:hypothetical protein